MTKEAVDSYLNSFYLLITSLQDAKPLDREYSIAQFNDVALFDRTYSASLDHIKKIKLNKQDLYLDMVLTEFQTTTWGSTYGLSVTDTMKLEYADFITMSESLKRHELEKAQKKDSLKDEVDKLSHKFMST